MNLQLNYNKQRVSFSISQENSNLLDIIQRNSWDSLELINANNGEQEQYFYHGDHLGSSSWITDANGNVNQFLAYMPFGVPKYFGIIDQRATGHDIRFKFTGKERDSETGFDYFGARYYSSDLSVWLSVDIRSHAHPDYSPYSYTFNKPINLIDPLGEDTIDIGKKDGKWDVTNTTIAKGNDVFRVTENGKTKNYTFSEGEYGNRINYLRMEDDEETFGIYQLSGTKTTGYIIEPEGPGTTQSNKNKRILTDSYSLDSQNGNNYLWNGQPIIFNDKVSKNRGIKIHYGTGRNWSAGCLVVSSDYTAKNGKIKFNLPQSQEESWKLSQYLGATFCDKSYRNRKGKIRHQYVFGTKNRISKSKLNIQAR